MIRFMDEINDRIKTKLIRHSIKEAHFKSFHKLNGHQVTVTDKRDAYLSKIALTKVKREN